MRKTSLVLLASMQLASCNGVEGQELDAAIDATLDATVPDGAAADAPQPIDATIADAASMPDAPIEGNEGWVSLSEFTEPMLGESSNATAAFVIGSIWGPTLGADGDCTLHESVPQAGWSAGLITIDVGGEPGTELVTLTPTGTAPDVSYGPVVAPPVDVFSPGATLTFGAAGSSDIPAFGGTVTAPGKVTGWTAPVGISRAAGWSTTWTAGAGGAMWIMVIGLDFGTMTTRNVTCVTPDDGAYTMPPSSLALLPASFSGGVVRIWRVNETLVAAGAFHVHLFAADGALSSFLSIGP